LTRIVYLDGEFMPFDEARISPDDRGFLFSDGAYEVVRCYDGVPFALEEHRARLTRSLTELRIDHSPASRLGDVCSGLLERNVPAGGALLYAQVTRGEAERAHPFPPASTGPTFYASVRSFEGYPREREEGVAVITAPDIRWGRCDIKSISLLPNVLAAQMARDSGASEAVLVRRGVITEGASSSFCAVLSGSVRTHPNGPGILPGITAAAITRLCRDLGIPFVEEAVSEDDLETAPEAFLLSTTREVMPVVSVDGMTIGGGKPGPVTRRLQGAFDALVRESSRGRS